jgi:hypothetical protein
MSSCAKNSVEARSTRSARQWERVAQRKTRPKLTVKSRQRSDHRTWEQFGNIDAQTPRKTGEQGRPENRANQQDRRPGPVCKTSTPGSNPGGASTFLSKNSDRLGATVGNRGDRSLSVAYVKAGENLRAASSLAGSRVERGLQQVYQLSTALDSARGLRHSSHRKHARRAKRPACELRENSGF